MGSWYGTCALTNLSIHYHEDVVAILLVEDDLPSWQPKISSGFVGTQRGCHPLAFPLFGKYDDGGSLEEIEKSDTTLALVEWLKTTDGVKLKEDNGSKYDIGDINSVAQAIERGLLSIPVDRKQRGVGMMLVHYDIYTSMVNYARSDKYMQKEFEALTRFASRDCTHSLMMQKMCEARMAKQEGEKFTEEERDAIRESVSDSLTFAEAMALPEHIRRSFIRNFKTCQAEHWESLGIVSENMRKNEDIFYFYLAMNAMRKQYAMQGGAGSQDQNDEIIDFLRAQTDDFIHERKNRRGD